MTNRIKVYGAVITHEYGITVFLGRTEESVIQKVFDYVVEWWSEASTEEPPPPTTEDKMETINWFFNNTYSDYESWDFFEEWLE